MLERDYQKHLIERLKSDLPGSIVLKNDPNYIQGIPDLLVLYGPIWIALEVKVSGTANIQPNQQYYIDKMSDMGQAYFIYPENEEAVFDAIQRSL